MALQQLYFMELIDKINEAKTTQPETLNIQLEAHDAQVENILSLGTVTQEQLASNSNRVRNIENETCDADINSKKIATAKLKFRKLKQRISNMCYKHEDITSAKEVTSANKPRIMKLSIELQKQVNNQVKDYNAIETVMKELLKILQQKRQNDSYNKRQNDLHILRQSKCIPSLMEFCKKILSLYKNQFRESFRLIEIVNRMLLIFCTSATNREYLIMTNRIPTLTSLLITLIKKQQATDLYLISNLYNIIRSLLEHKLQGECGNLILETVEYLHQCSIVKKTFSLLETVVQDGFVSSQHLVKQSLKFLISVFVHTDNQCRIRPIQQINSTPQSSSCLSNIESTISFLNQYSQYILPDKQSMEKTLLDGDLPVSSISNLLLITQTLSFCCKLNLQTTQKNIGNQILTLLTFSLRYSKQFCQQSQDLKQLLNRVIVLLGYLAFLNQQFQDKLNQCRIIFDLCNLPTKFIVDKKSIQILVPTLCCIVFRNDNNVKSVFEDLSTVYVKKFLKAQMGLHSNQQKSITGTPGLLTRKSSLSSMTSANTQCSNFICQTEKGPSVHSLKVRFPIQYWKQLYDRLDPLQ